MKEKTQSEPVVVEAEQDFDKAGISKAIEESMASDKAAKDAIKKPDKPISPVEKPDGETVTTEVVDKGGEATPPEVVPEEVTDSHVERAVKAGMSISDAKSFKDAKALERICGIMEKNSKPPEKPAEVVPEVDALSELDKMIAEIPVDLDPEVYDEEMIKSNKATKAIMIAQQKLLRELVKTKSDSGASTWFDQQVTALGKDYVEAIGEGATSGLDPKSPQAVKRDALLSKVKVLEAGYKAAGIEIGKSEVFREATSLVLGDVVVKAAEKARKAELEQRSSQHISRPSGSRAVPKATPEEETAAAIDKKFMQK